MVRLSVACVVGFTATLLAAPQEVPLRDQLRKAQPDSDALSRLVAATIAKGESQVRELKRLVDRQGAKQQAAYFKTFDASIEKARRVARSSVVELPAVKKLRERLIPLGTASYQLRDQLPGQRPNQDNKKQAQKKGDKPPTFGSFLQEQEDQHVQRWLMVHGLGKVLPNEASLLRAINQLRQSKGSPPLKIDDRLQMAAREHSHDMVKRRFYSHTSPVAGRRTHYDRARRYGARCFAENIGKGNTTPMVLQAWLRSDGHRRNLLQPGFKSVGIGISGNKYTLMFSTQAPPKKPLTD